MLDKDIKLENLNIWPQRLTQNIRRHGVVFVTFAVALFIATIDNLALWKAIREILSPLSAENIKILAAFVVVVIMLFFAGISLFGFKYVFKPVVAIFLITAATVSYFTNAYGVVIDRSMIQNLIETDVREATELLNFGLLWHVLVFGLAPAFLVFRLDIRHDTFLRELRRQGVVIVACLLLAGLTIFANYKDFSLIIRQNRHLRLLVNPSYPIYALATYAQKTFLGSASTVLTPIAASAAQMPSWRKREKKRVVVFVLGETARAGNFSLNGYARETNPNLQRQDILNFSNVQSCATSTADSVPCLFSGMTRAQFSSSKAQQQENLLDLLARSGIRVLWRDNNSGSKGVADRVPYQDMAKLKVDALCPDGECFDEILLHDLKQNIEQAEGDLFVVLHQKGSHGPLYYKRVPEAFRQFTPECRQDEVQKCTREEIVNAYDNTLLYTDYFLAKTIDLLKELSPRADTALLYMSDHGESLGENGIYLHGAPYFIAPEEQTHIPFVAWISDGFAKDARIDVGRIKQSSGTEYSHDNLFHIVLGLFSVKTEAYRPEYDIFSSQE